MTKQWNQFDHQRAFKYLKCIVDRVQSAGARVASCGEGKLTLYWPEGETIHLRRYHHGPYRWVIFTADGYNSLILARRDPSIYELQTALPD